MGSLRMWMSLLLVFVLSFIFSHHVSEAKHDQKIKVKSAVVVGTVYCDICFQQEFSRNSHFISGAVVAVGCRGEKLKPSFYKEVKTNGHGVFKVSLPFMVNKRVKKIKQCSVKLISSGDPSCGVASLASSLSLQLKSRNEAEYIFSAGVFAFKPLQQPEMCNRFRSIKTFFPTPNIPIVSPIVNPTPTLPFLPPLPSIGLPLPPNPLQPPSLPNPFLPSPPSIFPPGIVPGITPSPPSSILPVPPSLPFPPLPLIPGIPPAVSTSTKTSP
ncbi:hypothetical protein GIB67_003508 [Kingdonia uniflora]|uniref:Pollen Ole e 1 allergen and extensin family protein n=1 Tax=Kingdonia uniflora TaxID=39325 RepID=A0A7J7MF10_9MAGN|nr:hypothetical protein GIB67_003508 [Kingdonia uniflora]